MVVHYFFGFREALRTENNPIFHSTNLSLELCLSTTQGMTPHAQRKGLPPVAFGSHVVFSPFCRTEGVPARICSAIETPMFLVEVKD